MSERRFVDTMTGRGAFTTRGNEPGRPQPNIFFITVDMVPPEFHMGLPGRMRPRTPNLDRLRADSTVFTNAFSTSPLCTPSRASFLTGRFSYITTNNERAHDGHAIHLRDEDTIFPEYLKAAGYTVRHFGKSHVGTHKFVDVFGENDSPWDRWSPPWGDDDQYRRELAARGIDAIRFSRAIRGADPSGRGEGNNYGGWLAGPPGGSPFPIEATYPFFVARRAAETVELVRAKTPLYLQLDFFEPHQPFAICGGLEERERELSASIKPPESYSRILDNGFNAPWPEPRIYRLYRQNWGLTNPEVLRDYLVANILQYEILDAAVGLFLDRLKLHGLYESSCILFLADHGEMNGEWALIDKGAFLNPRVLRVPLFLKAGENAARYPSRFDRPVSLLDAAPTLLDAAGIRASERFDGLSLFDQLTGTERGAHAPVLAEVWSHVMPNPAVGAVFTAQDGRDYLYSFNTTDELDELYSLETDAELVNLVPARGALHVEAIRYLDRVLVADMRFRGYSSFLRLRHARHLEEARGDRQAFI